MALTDTFVKQVKHSGRPNGDKHSDGHGLYLSVTETSKYWRMNYRFAGKQKTLAFGVYPEVTLAKAREHRAAARKLLADGIDPSAAKRAQKAATAVAAASTLELVAREFCSKQTEGWSPRHGERWLQRMERHVFPYLGHVPLADLTSPMVLEVLRKVDQKGQGETARRLRQAIGQVCRYGIQTGRCERNPATDLQGALKPQVVKHMAAVLEPAKVGELMRAIDSYSGQPATRIAMQLSALLFQRPGNLRQMEWDWIDLDKAMLTIPAASMKRRLHQKLNGRPHLVPLSTQALALLRELQPLTRQGRYVFPSLLTGERPMSENTVNAALRRMGFTNEEMTAHGFRAMARTLMVEQLPGINPDIIEAQLAHMKSGPLGAAYDRAEYMDQRRAMMQTWADYLDCLRNGADVLTLRIAA